jgi:putative MATE family efflux protein
MPETHEGTQPEVNKFDLITGPILPTIIKLAWPVVATMFVHTAFLITDMIWVGRLGAPEMAGVISSVFIIWILFSVAEVVTAGLVAIIARHYGAKNYGRAGYVAAQAIGFSTLLSVVVTIIGFTFASDIMAFMGTEPDVAGFGVDYLRIRFAGALFLLWYEVGTSIFRATGDTKTPMVLSIVAVGGNILLDPCLIFGWGPFPEMGVKGAAIATVVANFGAVLGFAIYILRGRLTLCIKWFEVLRMDVKLIIEMVRIGLPLSLNGIVFSIVYVFINKITAEFGTEAIAALGVGNRAESVSYLICFGFAVAVSTMVGQNLGAGRPDRAEKAVWITLGITGAITLVITMAFLLIPELITRVFISDAKVIDMSVDYLRIMAISQVFMAAVIVLEGAFSGAGNTMPPMIIGIPSSVLRVPIAYVLCFVLGFGVNGVWWAITSTMVISGIVMVLWFRRGKWKDRKIDQ